MPDALFKPILTLALLACVLPAMPARAQATCDDALLTDASQSYDLGLFDEAIGTLKPCLPGRLRRGEQHFRGRGQATQALRLMALSYYAKREPDSTRQWVERLVKRDRGYQADPLEDPLFFQYLVDDLRPPRWYQKTWVQIGGALVVVGVVSYLLFKSEPSPLPGPEDVFRPPDN